jgi:hypothetical protein
MSSAHKRMKEYQSIIEGAGAEVVEIKVSGGTHYKFRCRVGTREFLYVCPFSSSDYRHLKNMKAGIRRITRAM